MHNTFLCVFRKLGKQFKNLQKKTTGENGIVAKMISNVFANRSSYVMTLSEQH